MIPARYLVTRLRTQLPYLRWPGVALHCLAARDLLVAQHFAVPGTGRAACVVARPNRIRGGAASQRARRRGKF